MLQEVAGIYCLSEMPRRGEKSYVVWKAVADPWDSTTINSIDPTQELTASEMVSREMDPVLSAHSG